MERMCGVSEAEPPCSLHGVKGVVHDVRNRAFIQDEARPLH